MHAPLGLAVAGVLIGPLVGCSSGSPGTSGDALGQALDTGGAEADQQPDGSRPDGSGQQQDLQQP